MQTNSKKLFELKREIDKINNELTCYKLSNKKLDAIRNIKISLKITQLLIPYIVMPGILAASLKLGGFGLPFYQDDINRNLKQMKEIDNSGNVRVEQQYKNFVNGYNKIIYYGNWKQNDDGTYSRNIEHYRLRNITEEEILNLYKNKIVSMKELFGNPISTKVETVHNISNDLIKEGYLQAIFYSEDKKKFITIEESIEDNISVTILFIIMTFAVEMSVYSIIGKKTKNKLKNFIEELDVEYSYEIKDTTMLEKKLNEAKRKYKILSKDTKN